MQTSFIFSLGTWEQVRAICAKTEMTYSALLRHLVDHGTITKAGLAAACLKNPHTSIGAVLTTSQRERLVKLVKAAAPLVGDLYPSGYKPNYSRTMAALVSSMYCTLPAP